MSMKRCQVSVASCILLFFLQSWSSIVYAQSNNNQHREFQIGVFYGPTANLTNIKQFQWIKEANVDFIQYVGDVKILEPAASEKRNLQLLDLAARVGLTYYVADPRIHDGEEGVAAVVNAYKDHPATAGYYIVDEPGIEGLDWAAKTYQMVRKLDPLRVPYVNLFPEQAVPEYETQYVHKWVEKAGKDALIYLSFDNYPFLVDGKFRDSNFNNLDIIRRAGLKYGVSTSSYLQSVGILGHYRRPSPADLRFSAYSNLSYGIKNLVWFTYNTPIGQPVEKFTNAIIDSLGNKTDLYKPFTKLNKELKQIGPVLMNLDAVAVHHSGEEKNPNIVPLPNDYFVRLLDKTDKFIITDFRDHNTNKRYLMLVNKALKEPKKINFRVDGKVKLVKGPSKRSSLGRKKVGNEEFYIDQFLPGEGKLYEITQ